MLRFFYRVNFLIPILYRFYPYREKKETYTQKNLEFFGYDYWPTAAVNEMRKMANKTKKILNEVTCPSLVIHSRADLLSPQSNISLVYDNITSKYKEKLILEKSGHNLFAENPNQNTIFQKVSEFLQKFPEK